MFFIGNCTHEILNKLFIKRIQDYAITQKKEITISLEYLGKISLLGKKQQKKQRVLEVAVAISNLTSFSKHQIDYVTYVDLKTSYTNVSSQVLNWKKETKKSFELEN